MPFTLRGLNPENPDDIQEPKISSTRVVSEEEMGQYYRELSSYMEAVPGYSFQKDVWSWRPLWVFICIKGADILSDEDMKKGQYNSGHCLRITKAKDFVSTYVLNLVAATDIIRTFQDNLKRNNGSIVMFSTVAAKKGFPNHSIISPAKAAVEGLTVALAAELAPHTRVNCIAPSLTKSKMSKFLLQNLKSIETISKLHPLKRIGESFDAANLAKFLLSKNSSWITGQIIGVDGGRAAIA